MNCFLKPKAKFKMPLFYEFHRCKISKKEKKLAMIEIIEINFKEHVFTTKELSYLVFWQSAYSPSLQIWRDFLKFVITDQKIISKVLIHDKKTLNRIYMTFYMFYVTFYQMEQ